MLTDPGLSRFLLVKIKIPNKFKFTIPIAFIVFDDLLDVLEDWMWLFEMLVPHWKIKANNFLQNHSHTKHISWSVEIITSLCKLPGGLLYELRKYGKWKLVEVDTSDAYVSVEFY